MSYERVLPKPLALHYENSPSHNSTPLQHKVMTDVSRDDCRRSTALELRNQLPTNNEASSIHPSYVASSTTHPVTAVAAVLASPLPRKRTISLVSSEASREERSASASSSRSSSSRDSGLQFCLCQPEPKIPRPPNAFLLFRQHSQRDVSAQNPGMPNPQISQIIGEMWQCLSNESKQEWKNLAEEVKARHKQQYPDYKYQPRRRGRNQPVNSIDGSGTSQTPSGLLVCNRCGGRVMNPPATPTTPLTLSVSQTGSSSTLSQSDPPSQPILSEYRLTQLDPSKSEYTNGDVNWRAVVSNRFGERNSPLSPGKRRRFNNNNSSSIHFPRFHDTGRDISLPRRTSILPRPERLVNGNHQVTLPAARAFFVNGSSEPHAPGLTLPPLRATPSPRQAPGDAKAMVMAIPFINKIKTLAMISPPLEPSKRCRGAVISVEGQTSEAVKRIIGYVQESFARSQVVREFEGPKSDAQERGSAGTGDSTEQYLQYHRTISSWLNISGDIVDFMTRKSIEGEPGGCSTATIAKTMAMQGVVADSNAIANDSNAEIGRIALIPQYQLTTTDAHACMARIRDSYGPMDHWQWMASLWRGCVGPDITIVIQDCDQEEMERFGGGTPVENRLNDAATLVVRRVAGSSASLEEKALRRVGFEVEEFLRR